MPVAVAATVVVVAVIVPVTVRMRTSVWIMAESHSVFTATVKVSTTLRAVEVVTFRVR